MTLKLLRALLEEQRRHFLVLVQGAVNTQSQRERAGEDLNILVCSIFLNPAD